MQAVYFNNKPDSKLTLCQYEQFNDIEHIASTTCLCWSKCHDLRTQTEPLNLSTVQYNTTLLWTTSAQELSAILYPSPDLHSNVADINAGTVVLTITANASSPCNDVSSSMTLSITRQANCLCRSECHDLRNKHLYIEQFKQPSMQLH